MSTQRRCDSCDFWGHDTITSHAGNASRCRVNPPTRGSHSAIGMWPVTRADDWCGKWAAIAPPNPPPPERDT